MADQYWGRFKSIVVFTAVVGVGHIILVGKRADSDRICYLCDEEFLPWFS